MRRTSSACRRIWRLSSERRSISWSRGRSGTPTSGSRSKRAGSSSLKPPEVRKYLFDIAEACSLVASFPSGRSFEDYTGDPMLRSAVERQFEIVGEALGALLCLARELALLISDT